MKDGERERPIENYGKKEQNEWLANTLPDPHPYAAGNKEEENMFDIDYKFPVFLQVNREWYSIHCCLA